MLRAIVLLLTALLLAGCRVVFVPVPVPVDLAALQLPTPTPESAAATFSELYNALDAPYLAMSAHLDVPAWDDPEWRAELARRAAEWRAAIVALQGAKQPDGPRWGEAWPVLQEALDEYAYVAGAVEAAAAANDQSFLGPVRDRLVNGVSLMREARRILGKD